MKIRLEAFNKLYSDVMDIPENTGLQFKLAMVQPIQVGDFHRNIPSMPALHKMATFEFGGLYSHGGDVMIYKLVDLN